MDKETGFRIVAILFATGIMSAIIFYHPMSDGHKAADARYKLCLETSKQVSEDSLKSDYSFQQFDPSKCNGALGEYQND